MKRNRPYFGRYGTAWAAAAILAGGGAYAQLLNPVQTLFNDIVGTGELLRPSSIALSPDGSHAYVTAIGGNAISVYARSRTTGLLTFLEAHRDGENGVDGLAAARSAAVSPDGAHVYAASFLDGAVAIFSRNPSTGRLAFGGLVKDGVGGVDGLDGASGVAVAPDGAHVYVTAEFESALTVFARDAATGALSFVETFKQGVNGVDGLQSAYSVAVAPDGGQVYATAYFGAAVSAFARDGVTGALTPVQTIMDGDAGAEGLDGAASVAVAPDGASVYVAGYFDNAVTQFSRDGATGLLSHVETIVDGTGDVTELSGAHGVAVAPDGEHVYAAALSDSALTAFFRDGGTGNLTMGQELPNNTAGATGLQEAYFVTVSSDGAFVYTTAIDDNAVAVFATGKTPAGPIGDVNGEGFVNAVDVQLAINAALGIAIDEAFDADVNNDGETNAVDVQLVINAALGA